MVSRKALSITLLTLLCAWSTAAKFSFSPSQLRQFNIRHRRNVVGPSPAFRPAAIAPNTVTPNTVTPNAIAAPTPNTVTITVSTTTTSTSTATSLSTDTVFRQSVASTTITNTVTAQAATPPPAVVHMHTTHIAIIPRETQAVYIQPKAQEKQSHKKSGGKSSDKPRMRKVHHRQAATGSGSVSKREHDEGVVALAMPRSENIASIKRVHREGRASSELWRPASASASDASSSSASGDNTVNETRDLPADLARLPLDVLSGASGVEKSASSSSTSTTSTTSTNVNNGVNGDVNSARLDVLDVAANDGTATGVELVSLVFAPVSGSGPLSVDEAGTGAGAGSSTGTSAGTGSSASTGADAGSVDLVNLGVASVGSAGIL